MRGTAATISILLSWTIGCGQGARPAGAMASSADGGDARAAAPGPSASTAVKGLIAIWGSSTADVWAVGEMGAVAHFDEQSWTTSNVGTSELLDAVHGTGPSDVWAAGGDGTVFHWDGTAWASANAVAGTQLLGIWANGPADVWAVGTDNDVGAGYVRHWDGSTWQDADATDCRTFWRAWSSGPENVWLVGTSTDQRGCVMRGKGTSFTNVPFDGGQLRGVWGTSADDVWVASYDGSIIHWDGSSWTPATLSPPLPALLAMSGSAPDDAWAVGLGGAIYHYDGGSWSSVPSQTDMPLLSVWSRTRTDAWSVGGATLLRWDGSVWRH